MATITQLRTGLAATTVPAEVADTLLRGASPLWLSTDTAAQLAEDLALCHPPLKPAEVRARVVGGDDEWRLSVVAHDRNGLLADIAAILAGRGYSVRSASGASWRDLGIALLCLTVAGPVPPDDALDLLGDALRANQPTDYRFTPAGRAQVSRSGDANGDPMISVVAPDQPGLLAAISRFMADAGASIEAAWITGEREAHDVFVVRGEVDVSALQDRLSVHESLVDQARRVGEDLLNRLLKKQ